MRYLILVPPKPVDPRALQLSSMADLREALPIVADCETEREASNLVRKSQRDAVAMPVPVKCGSGEIFLLGFVKDPSRSVDPDAEIPYVMFVQCQAQNEVERLRLKKDRAKAFDRSIWKIPVIRPELAKRYRVDLRATDLEVPAFTDAIVGESDGKLTIYVEVGGIEMSLMFDDPRVGIEICSQDDMVEIPGTD